MPGIAPHILAGMVLFLITSTAAWAQDRYRVADGLAVYLGLIPATLVLGHPPTDGQRAMHGGTRAGPHSQHIVIAIFDANTGSRITNAAVTATVSSIGHVGHQVITLEQMTIADSITYGAFFDFDRPGRYDISVTIRLPGRRSATIVSFPIEHF